MVPFNRTTQLLSDRLRLDPKFRLELEHRLQGLFASPKSLMYPALTDRNMVHTAVAMPETRTVSNRRDGCAGWLHVANQYKPRFRGLPEVPADQQGQFKIPKALLWPLEQHVP